MKATTKFDIKDNVWLVYDNKAVRRFVTGLVVTFTEPDSHDVKSDLNYSLCEIPENKLFKTKEELLESL